MTGYSDRTLDSLRGMLKWNSIGKDQKGIINIVARYTIGIRI